MISRKRYFGAAADVDDAEAAQRFRVVITVITELFELSGTNSDDFLPELSRVVDFKGREQKMVDVAKRSDVILQGMMDELRSRRKRSDGDQEVESKMMIDSMPSEGYSDDIIKGQILVCV